MLECLYCGKPLPRSREKGHREREYCNDLCRKRAWRAKNKDKHRLDRIIREAHERMWNAIEQGAHRETWQDELDTTNKLLTHMFEEQESLRILIQGLKHEIAFLQDRLADKDAEITRLTVLLEGQAKRRR